MINNKKILAVITARAGSKRLPNKNILDLAGKPLIAWTIQCAKKAKFISKIIVSTDSIKIKDIAEKYGAEVPFIRPKELATDSAKTISVLKHAILFYNNKFDYILLLQPTSPLRETKDIDTAIELLGANTEAIVSVCKTEHSPLWTNVLSEDLSMSNFMINENTNTHFQELPKYYRINGAIYLAKIDYFYQANGFIGNKTKAYIMPKSRSIDIDTDIDFEYCKNILNNEKKDGIL